MQRVLPHREPGTAAAPHLHHVRIRARRAVHPREELPHGRTRGGRRDSGSAGCDRRRRYRGHQDQYRDALIWWASLLARRRIARQLCRIDLAHAILKLVRFPYLVRSISCHGAQGRSPGPVDLHTHSYWGVPPLSIEPDPHLLHRGVTTAVDAGSAGASTFPGFRRYVIDVAATRILAFLNISQIGMAQDRGPAGHIVGELEDLRWARVDRAIEVALAHPDVVVGIKVRLSRPIVGPDPAACREALRRSREAAGAIGKPVMVHIGSTPAPLDELLPLMKPGDLVTTASKFLHLSLSLGDVLSRITAAPARALGLAGQVGTLAPGAAAE